MKISIPRQHLVEALQTVKGAISTRATVPILGNVSLVAKGKKLELAGTDLDLSIRHSIECDVLEAGGCTVNAALFFSLANTLTGIAPVELTALTNDLKIVCGDSKYKFGTLPVDDFPPLPKLKEPVEFELPQAVIRSLVEDTCFCVSTDDSRPVLGGSLVRLNGSITVVGCNGFQAAVDEAPIESTAPKTDLILPAKAINQLLRLLSSDVPEAKDGETPPKGPTCIVTASESMAQFRFGDTVITTKLVDGKYPNYKEIIPKQFEEGITLARTDLLACLKRVDLVSDNCTFEVEGQLLTLRSRGRKSEVQGDAVESLFIAKHKKVEVGFRTAGCIAALEAVNSDEVILHLTDATSVAVFKVKDRPWLSVISPVRENNADKEEAKPAPAK